MCFRPASLLNFEKTIFDQLPTALAVGIIGSINIIGFSQIIWAFGFPNHMPLHFHIFG